MSESAYAARNEEFDDYGDDAFEDEQLPRRHRRRWLNGWTVGVLAVLIGAGGFYVGVRVEKSSVSGSGSSSSLASAFAARFRSGAAGAASRSGSGQAGTGTTTGSGTGAASSGAATQSAAGALPGAGRFGGNATVGTVSSVNGNTIYLKDSSGNTVKVKISKATQVTKRQTVSKKKVYPGDTLLVQGATNSGGTVAATSITDSGSSGSSSTSSSGSTSSGSGSSVIGSLFGGG